MRTRPSPSSPGAAAQPAEGSPERRPKERPAARAPRPPVSRRRFMALLASASAASLAAPARPLIAAAGAATATRRLPPAPAPTPRVAAEIEKQKKYVADTLKVLRDFSLPPGSPMAFEFQPMRAKRGK
jgi:hypothetical protein